MKLSIFVLTSFLLISSHSIAAEKKDVFMSKAISVGVSGMALSKMHDKWLDLSASIGYCQCWNKGGWCLRLKVEASLTDFERGFGMAIKVGGQKHFSSNRDPFSIIFEGEVKAFPDEFGETIFRTAVYLGPALTLLPWDYGARIELAALVMAGFESRETGFDRGGGTRFSFGIFLTLHFPIEFKLDSGEVSRSHMEHY